MHSFQVEEEPAGKRSAQPSRRPKLAYGVGAFVIATVVVVAAITLSCNRTESGLASGGDATNQDISEQTIWVYLEDSKLSGFQELCKDTIEKNKGHFTLRFIQKDNVRSLVKHEYLPANWEDLDSKYQKDTVMNALLYQYGGVALDLSLVMFRSLDTWWDSMKAKNVSFKGFYTKSRSEAATWFMMAPKGGKTSEAIVERQVRESGNKPDGCPEKVLEKKLSYGSHMVSFGLCKVSSEYCSCYFSETKGCELTALVGEAKMEDVNIDIDHAARETVQSPLRFGKSGLTTELEWPPFADKTFDTEKFSDFQTRFHADLPFITVQGDIGKNAERSKEDLLKEQNTFFYHWLCLAGHSETDEDVCGQR